MSDTDVHFRKATRDDLPAIVAMLADDELGQHREDASLPLNKAYTDAFAAIEADPNQLLVVAEDKHRVVGNMQITFIPGIGRLGAVRGQIEAVRISKGHRNFGIGETMFQWAIEQCAKRGCNLVQLTTDKTRPDAHRFYDRLGFEASHEGYKLKLPRNSPQ